MGFESVLAQEVKALGYQQVSTFNNKVEFEGGLEDICKSNLWLRSAGRIYVKIASFKACSFDELFDHTKTQPWSTWIQKDDQFPVTTVSSRKSALFSKSDCQAIVKKAIAEQLKKAHGCRLLPETKASFPIRIQIENDIVTLSIDSSGTGLNKRGYRAHMNIAPLRETLAAGLILLSRWNPNRHPLLDPFCGTGTLLIEAGLIAQNIAPGLHRSFNSEQWSLLPKPVWEKARTDANDLIKKDCTYHIYGSDNNEKALTIAKKNSQLAGLKNIVIEKKSLNDLSPEFETGKIITNPPYGNRLSNEEEINNLYSEMGNKFLSQFTNWSYYILTPSDNFEYLFGKTATKHRKVYNGGTKCWYYQYYN